MTSATLLSSTSPPSNSTSAALSRIHPGMISVPLPVPVCCDGGGSTRMWMSVAVECLPYIVANVCTRSSLRAGSMPASCECETTEKPDTDCAEKLLSMSAETREN